MRACTKCGSAMITQNNKFICFVCPGKKQGVSKPGAVAAIDPGEAYFAKGKSTATPQMGTATVQYMPPAGGSVADALKIMKTLAMPDDIKQFKQIKKIISLLEKLEGEQNVN